MMAVTANVPPTARRLSMRYFCQGISVCPGSCGMRSISCIRISTSNLESPGGQALGSVPTTNPCYGFYHFLYTVAAMFSKNAHETQKDAQKMLRKMLFLF